jgi:hypothetical protein
MWQAVDTCKEQAVAVGTPLAQYIEQLPDTVTSGTVQKFVFVPGMRYIYTTNTATQVGIANGIEGVATSITLHDEEPADDG